jgi:hypothetical protein
MQEENKNNNEEEKKLDKKSMPSDKVESNLKEDESKPKNGIDILKDIGLKNVSNKTFINLENLTYLLDKDFEKLHKTKALGFIQILQRDFNVDLSELKDDYLDFQSGGKRKVKKKINSKKEISSKKIEKKENLTSQVKNYQAKRSPQKPLNDKTSDIKIGPYILIALAGLLGYYLFSSATKDESQLEVLDLNVVQNEPIVKKAKENLLVVEAQANNTNTTLDDEDIDLNKVVHEMFKEADINESEQIDEQEDINTTTTKEQDTNSTLLPEVTSIKKDEVNTTQVQTSLENVKDLSTNEENNKTQEKKPINKLSKKEEIKTDVSQVKSFSFKDELYIIPTKKAWVGVIYLDNFRKKDFLIRKKLKLDSSRNQIILVGHRNFKIYSHGEKESFNSKKMVRFIYEGGNLREISKAEYLKRSAGVRW